MTDEPIDPELDRLFDLLAEEERGEPDPVEHPGAATLSAYHAHTLSADQVPGVQEHLVLCRQCRAQLLEYAEFMGASAEESEENVSSFERAAEWRLLKERMGEEPLPAPRRGDYDRQTRKRRLSTPSHIAYSLVAVLTLALVGVSLYAGSIARELRRPVAVDDSEPLAARGSKRSSSIPSRAVRLPVSLTIEVSSPKIFPKYRADFRDERGALLWSVKTKKIQEDGTIKLYLPSRCLAPGSYQVILWGLQGSSQEDLGVYDVRIVT